ncbi:alanyl-tRNA synthetase [Thermanaerovibrio acidaminovorans DSM 6589]|uniref:Alanine--tRNA ligase n=1 Tax=Thermanaerovibrio acidaminovorans (strain ATCC 49978 / DSM 6589 / Su883) TaxID=525903 RepID=D1B5H4_THEAS|nr:alanine--tRNA ligase [Thermanaerovibrio acidaminovorans]ACZ19265.1 alanyl-tRNA synthetase [Thermanaerovibrio acidaminovorans DSM 6589]
MKWRSGNELREMFLSFFEEKGCVRYPSASLVPDDPSLLFTIAGMVPFKPYFLGIKEPKERRVTTAQKCIRTNDIDNVGRTARHHTFFEMLGNFSFGDYFKAEVIPWAWEFLTQRVGMDPDRLYVTVFRDDDEAESIWMSSVGVPKDRIFRMGEEDNFWAAGPVGPCGPCSEIIYDQGPEFSCGKPSCGVGCDCDRYLEVWNLVFMQYNRDEAGNLTPLPRKNIDTGMGLERLSSVVQWVRSDFETDLFKPIIDRACQISGVAYGSSPQGDLAVRVISDHIRAAAFMVADGVLPSNEGPGYVLRRLIRRTIRFGRLLGIDRPFLLEVLPVVEQVMGGHYGELVEHRSTINQVLELEESRFLRTLEQGSALLEEEVRRVRSRGLSVFPGEVAFELYDTYGFPLELTSEMCQEQGLSVDIEAFERAMERQRELARSGSKHASAAVTRTVYSDVLKAGRIRFIGYDSEEGEARVVALVREGEMIQSAREGDRVEVFLDVTPFYGEKGGQVGDRGEIRWDGGLAQVEDAQCPMDGLTSHLATLVQGELRVGQRVFCRVDGERRWHIRRHHTATHILHEALGRVLGGHVRQSGSWVGDGFFRFDFNHFSPLSDEEIARVEDLVNQVILEDRRVTTLETSMDSAREMGAKALFDEKYGQVVRVVSVEGFSTELCGGTHVSSSGQIGLFKIQREEGIGSGLRRITATAGLASLEAYRRAAEVVKGASSALGVEAETVRDRIMDLMREVKSLERELRQLRLQVKSEGLKRALEAPQEVKGIKVLSFLTEDSSPDELRAMGDSVREMYPDSVCVLISRNGGKFMVIVMCSDGAVSKGVKAGSLIKSLGALWGFNAGGKANTAQGGGEWTDRMEGLLRSMEEQVSQLVSEMVS